MTVTKLALIWNRKISDFEFCNMAMFKATDDEHACDICFENGKHVEWDVSEYDVQATLNYLQKDADCGDAGAENLIGVINQNLANGATFIRFRSVERVVEIWMAM